MMTGLVGMESLGTWALAWVVVVFLVAGFVHGVIGFGFPIIAMPLLAAVIDHKAALVLSIFPILVLTVINVFAGGRLGDSLARFWYMLPVMIAGSVIGTKVIIAAPPEPFILLLAASIFLFLNRERFGRSEFGIVKRHPHASGIAFAFVAGLFEATANIAAPVAIIYFMLIGLDPRALVQTLNLLFLGGKGAQVATWTFAGGLGWRYWMGVLPWTAIALVTFVAGMRIRMRMPIEVYMRWLRRFLWVMLVVLLVQFAWMVGPARAQAPAATTTAQSAPGPVAPADQPPAHAAAADGDVARLREFLSRGTAVDARNQGGETLLFVAAEYGRTDAVKLLLERGADPRARTPLGETTLHAAALYGDPSIAAELLARGVDANAVNEAGEAPLAWAAGAGHAPMALLLLERGARIDHQDKVGLTALHFAAAGGYPAVIDALLARRANATLRGADGKTALDLARERGEAQAVQLLEGRAR